MHYTIILYIFQNTLFNTHRTVSSASNSTECRNERKDSLPSEYVLKEGKSKFNRKSMDDLDKLTDDEADYEDPQTVETDGISQTSVETAETIPAKDPLE